jgi:hypothetical protein
MSKIAHIESKQVVLDKEYVEDIEEKASFLEDLLAFIEHKYLGFLMKETEKEENIPVSKAKKLLK